MSTIFGRIVTGADVEQAVVSLLRRWFGTYLAEVERQHGIEAGSWQRPRAYVVSPSFDKWPEDQLPAVQLVSAGIEPRPEMEGAGRYRARWVIGCGCIVSARTQEESHVMSMAYVAALRVLLLQKQSLEGFAAGVEWLDEAYVQLEYDDIRSLASGQGIFAIEVVDVTSARAGPVTPDEPLPDETEPWPDWPVAETVEVLVEQEELVEP